VSSLTELKRFSGHKSSSLAETALAVSTLLPYSYHSGMSKLNDDHVCGSTTRRRQSIYGEYTWTDHLLILQAVAWRFMLQKLHAFKKNTSLPIFFSLESLCATPRYSAPCTKAIAPHSLGYLGP